MKDNFRRIVTRAALRIIPEAERKSLPWDTLRELMKSLPEASGGVKSAVKRACSLQDPSPLFSESLDPQKYESSVGFHADALLLSFLKKYPFTGAISLDPKAAAMSSFWKAEQLCRQTNKRVRHYAEHAGRLSRKFPFMESITHRARTIVADVLCPRSDTVEQFSAMLDMVFDGRRFGPGTWHGNPGLSTQSTAYFKYAVEYQTVTSRARPYAVAAIMADDNWRQYLYEKRYGPTAYPSCFDREVQAVETWLRTENSNKVAFVPKTAKTHRAIAAEPGMNVFLQLGVGTYIRNRMKVYDPSFNLDDQRPNQELAYLGSLKEFQGSPDCPSTIDLSMASDTLATQVVFDLLPLDWFYLLDDLRCHTGVLEGERVQYAKFSSMGNGFTFELESLIFYALTRACVEFCGLSRSTHRVYGDDIIVPFGAALLSIEVLTHFGFKVNEDKSFVFGPFRESCGEDFFEGSRVRPVHLKKELRYAKDLILLANQLRRVYHQHHLLGGANDRERLAYRHVVSRIPRDAFTHLRGPQSDNIAEGHLECDLDEAATSRFVIRARDGWQGWNFASLVATAIPFGGIAEARRLQYLETLRGIRSQSDHESDDLRLLALGCRSIGTVPSRDPTAVTIREKVRHQLANQYIMNWPPTAQVT